VVQVIDVLTNVNVEFMLCPTEAMSAVFSKFPPYFVWPSHRFLLTIVVCVFAFPISYTYIYLSRGLMAVFGATTKRDSKVRLDEVKMRPPMKVNSTHAKNL